LAVDHFQTGKLDQAVAAFGIKARGFGIKDNLAFAHKNVVLFELAASY
jgi:hypothetical protein